MKPGDRVKIKTKDGRKIKGLVTDLKLDREDAFSPVTYTLTVVLEDPRELT